MKRMIKHHEEMIKVESHLVNSVIELVMRLGLGLCVVLFLVVLVAQIAMFDASALRQF